MSKKGSWNISKFPWNFLNISKWNISSCIPSDNPSAPFTRATLCYSAGLCDSDVSVCLSVRLSHAGIVPSRAKAGSWNVHHLTAPFTLVSGEVWLIEKFARGHPKATCQMRVGWVFSAIFDQYIVISRKRCILDTKLLWGGNRKP